MKQQNFPVRWFIGLFLLFPSLLLAGICNSVTEIEVSECEALVAIYNSTNGEQWTNNSGWLVTNTPCSWEGIECQNGHVDRLYLQYNNLTGSIPSEIEGLSYLGVLNISHNKLCGDIPVELMNIDPPLWAINFDNNHLTATDSDLIQWLNIISPDWMVSQTSCPSVQFTAASYSVGEDGGQVTIVVSRTGSNGDVSVDYATNDDTAFAGSDYAQSSGFLFWEDGDSSDKTFTVHIIEDAIVENSETFSLTLFNLSGDAFIGEPGSTAVTIVDNDSLQEYGTLQFSSTEYSVNESNGHVTINVKRVNGNDGAVSVNYITSDDTAIAGSDYVQGSGTLNWSNQDSADKSFTVNVTSDDIKENNETFIVSLGSVTGGAELGVPDTTVVTIIDSTDICNTVTEIDSSECEALVAIYNNTNGIQWSNNTGWLVTNTPCSWNGVQCKNGHVDRLYLQYNNLTGSISSEIEGLSYLGVLNISHNDLCGDIPIELMNMEHLWALALNSNHLTATDSGLIEWLNNLYPGWNTNQTSCPIIQNSVQFTVARHNVSENGKQVAVVVSRVGSAHGAVSVNYATSDNTAIAGSDYTQVSGTLFWNNGESNNKTVIVHLIDNSIQDGNKTFDVTLSSLTGDAIIGNPSRMVVTIIDNDVHAEPGTVQFSSATDTVFENGGSANVTVSRVYGRDGAISVKCNSSNGGATAGEDYFEVTKNLRWSDGDIEDKTCAVPIINDTDIESNEAFSLSLENATGGATIGAPNTTVVTILDNDSTPGTCNTVTEIESSECDALVAIFKSTNGVEWGNNTGWLVTNTPCSWNGIQCRNGHVERLYLQYNQLTGSLPSEIEDLSYLGVLNISHNELCGDIPVELMNMVHLWALVLNNNHLTASDSGLIDWLNNLSPGWDASQTQCN